MLEDLLQYENEEESSDVKQERFSTVRSRELGEHLRRVRRQTNFKTGQLLEMLEWSAGKLSKLEKGTRGTSPCDIAFLLGALNVDLKTREQIIALAEESDTGSFLRLHHCALDTLPALLVDEDEAVDITSYDPVGIPEMVQTEDYALALIDDPDLVAARMRRQRPPKGFLGRRMTVFIHESALAHVVGSTWTMRDQLLQLALLAGSADTSIRIIPRSCGLHVALCRPATLLTLDPPLRPVVHVETDVATVFHDDPGIVEVYRNKMRQIDRLALDHAQSRELLAQWSDRYDTPEPRPGGAL
ncbi:helix-turn-helix transcriptional regulator [Saccharothrix xinjiangensis]|uniref:Helix-turn-helix domain-containing protein n=1 Tax=Saccharothrix xinjiangensis TaxID=204798 RepID=A0ABV9Y1S7_9PSEU